MPRVFTVYSDNCDMLVPAFMSQSYSQIWSWQVVEKLMYLPQGWRVSPARTAPEAYILENRSGATDSQPTSEP